MLSRFNWDLQLGLLRHSGSLDQFSGSPPEWKLDRSIDEISLAARGMVEPTLVKDRIEDALRGEWRKFLSAIYGAAESESPRVFDLFDANLKLISSSYDLLDLRDVHDDLCGEIASPGADLVYRLFKILEDEIGEFEVRALRLGKLVDQGIHPHDVFRLTYQEPVDFDRPRIDPEQPRRGSWWLAARTPTPGEQVPGRDWFRQVGKRWEELDLALPLPEAFLRFADDIPDCDGIEDFAAMIGDVNLAAMAALTRAERRNPASSDSPALHTVAKSGAAVVPGYLGLLLDKESQVAGRAGREARIELKTSMVLWQILLKLEIFRENFCPKDTIKSCWNDSGREENPQDGAIYQAISVLRTQLRKKLGLDIKNKRDEGWSLVNIGIKII